MKLSPRQAQEFLDSLTDDEAIALAHDWPTFARPEQMEPPGEWSAWIILAGRGFGKTRAGAEWVRQRVYDGAKRIALIAETQKDLEEVMVGGDSGLLSVFPPGERPDVRYRPLRIKFHTGAEALGYVANEPDQLRGPQFDTAWCDELAKWNRAQETWDMLQFTMRLGESPRTIITTTPRGPRLIKDIMAMDSTVVTRGSTRDNLENLAPLFVQSLEQRYAGTRLGRQELDAEILEDVPGALWQRSTFGKHRITDPKALPSFSRIVVAVDPAISTNEHSDETGIICAGLTMEDRPRAVILEDASGVYTPSQWGRQVAAVYHRWNADRIVAEANQGGDMVKHVINTAVNARIHMVHASRGKVTRAEPASALYEQGRVSHYGRLDQLEDQMAAFTPDFDRKAQGYSPDRLDAAVWALADLFPQVIRPSVHRGQTAAPRYMETF